jgi:serine/threonine-protein kinase
MDPLLDSALDGSDPFEGTKYRSIAILGKGGMGAAHVVEHRRLGTRFACKILRGRHRDNPALADRMRLEAQSLARMSHANVVRVFDFDFTPEGRPFIVMELLEGHTLTQELRERGELPCAEAIHWTCQLLSALSAAHSFGIVHRDVKLDNLFLHRLDNGVRILKVLDFGIAKIQDGVALAGLEPPQVPTRAGAIVGTPRFLSPEAAMGRSVDHRADVYGAGVVLYMLICGRGPWDDASSHASVFAAQTRQAPLAPSKYASQPVPETLDAAVLLALNIEPQERFQTAHAFETALRSISERLPAYRLQQPGMIDHRADPLGGRDPLANANRLDLATRSATFRLSDAAATETEVLPTHPERSGASYGFGARIFAFLMSSASAAAITWWLLAWVFGR